MTPTLLLIHGWGFGPAFWNAFREAMYGVPSVTADLGYFGTPSLPKEEGAVVAVGHSTGALLTLRAPPASCIGLVSINGFDHFVALDDADGVPSRIVGRMASRLQTDAIGTVAEFRARCGDHSPVAEPVVDRLAEHLHLLRTADERRRAVEWPLPLLALSGREDPILPAELRKSAFSGARHLDRIEHPEGGHLLPVSHPAWCAEQVQRWLAAL